MSLGLHRKRIAYETYWELRRQAQSIRGYLATHYKGSSATQEYADLWTMGEILDGQLDIAHRSCGVAGVNHSCERTPCVTSASSMRHTN